MRSSIKELSGRTSAERESFNWAAAVATVDCPLANSIVIGLSSLSFLRLSFDTVDSFKKVTSAPESNLAVIATGCPRSHPSVFCFFDCLRRTLKAFLVLLISSATEEPVGEGVTAWIGGCGVTGTFEAFDGELTEDFNKCLGAQLVPGTAWLA